MRLTWRKTVKLTIFSILLLLLELLYIFCHDIVMKIPVKKLQENHYHNSEDFSAYSSSVRKTTAGSTYLDEPYDEELGVNSTCEDITFPLHLARENDWQAAGKSRTAYVFAAYFVKIKNIIVVIGIKADYSPNYICQLWFQNDENVTMEESPADVSPMSEGHGRRYTGVFFHCASPSSGRVPTHVSIVTKSCETPQNLLKIQFTDKGNVTKRRFTVCLTPLNFQYDKFHELIEWVELNRILGAEKFVIYNYSSGVNVERVLEYYSKRGIIELIPWNIPVQVNTWPEQNKSVEIHYFGQIAALNDCLYRNKNTSVFIVNLDLDEFIIPHEENTTTWSGILDKLKGNIKVYLFRNTFFKKEWDNAEVDFTNKSLVAKLQLVTLQKLQHERKISLPAQRSKYFARTDEVYELMIHEVPGVQRLNVPVETGLLHHYRNWNTTNDPPHVKVNDKTVPDKFSDILIENVQKVMLELQTG